MQCNSTQLRRIDLLRQLPEAALAELSANCHTRLCDKGRVIYRQGEHLQDVHLVCAGSVKLTRTCTAGKERILALIGAGDVVDGEALLDQAQRTHTAVALAPSVLVVCPGQVFGEFLLEHPPLSLRFTFSVLSRLRETERRLTDMTSGTVRKRLTEALVHLGESFGVPTDNGTIIQLPLRQHEIGQYIAASRETTSLLLNDMRRQQLIDFGHDWIRLHSIEAPDASDNGTDALA